MLRRVSPSVGACEEPFLRSLQLCGSPDHKHPLVLKARSLGAPLSGTGLKFGVPHVGFKPFALQGKALGFAYPPDGQCCAGHGVYSKIVAQPLLPALIWTCSHWPDAKELLSF